MPKVAYVDVDDTLVRSAGTKRIPMVSVVRHVRALKEEVLRRLLWVPEGSGKHGI
jgi:hypothetical protein